MEKTSGLIQEGSQQWRVTEDFDCFQSFVTKIMHKYKRNFDGYKRQTYC